MGTISPCNQSCLSLIAELTVSLSHTLDLILLLDGITAAQNHCLGIVQMCSDAAAKAACMLYKSIQLKHKQ